MPPSTDEASPLHTALTQRNQAIACAILSITISLALIMDTFLGHRKGLQEAHAQIELLNGQLRESQASVVATQKGMLQVQRALLEAQHALERARADNSRR